MMSNGWKTVAAVGAWAIGAMLFYPLTACTESASVTSYPDHYSTQDVLGELPTQQELDAIWRRVLVSGEREPPITQQEIDAYSKIRAETQYATLDVLQQSEAFIALLKRHGLSHKRFYFLAAKIPLVTRVALGQEVQGNYLNFPDSLKPTPEEISLVKKNWEKLVRPGSPSLEAAREQDRTAHEE